MMFYSAIAATELAPPYYLTEAQYEDQVNMVFERYNDNANYVSYLVTASQHCYTPMDITYSADTTGKKHSARCTRDARTTGC